METPVNDLRKPERIAEELADLDRLCRWLDTQPESEYLKLQRAQYAHLREGLLDEMRQALLEAYRGTVGDYLLLYAGMSGVFFGES